MPIALRILKPDERRPLPLLLRADPSPEAVAAYPADAIVFVADCDRVVVGVLVLAQIAPTAFEILNVAVAPDCEGHGIGRALLAEAAALARAKGARAVEIGTGNSSLRQLTIYQRFGFRIVGVLPDFFADRYDELVVEHGIPCRDMVRLRLTL